MTYLALVYYKVPIKFLFFTYHVFRSGNLIIQADSDIEAFDKIRNKQQEKDSLIYSFEIYKSL